jgi:hypothetical protein
MSNDTTLSSVADFLAVVETAEQRLADGEEKAHRAKTLLLQAEKARDGAAARKSEAEQQLAVVETALTKARALRALVGDETISQGEALLEQTWAEAQAEVTRLQTEAETAQVEAEHLAADPEVLAYLDYHDAQKRAEREALERAREGLQAQLAALRPAVAVGRGAEPLADLAARAEKAGFPDLAAQARDAADAACQVAQAQVQAEAALRKRRLIRWAEGRARQAQPGDFVFVVDKDGKNGDEQQAAIHLRSLPARSGRLRFQIVAALGMENYPDEYGDVPARGRVWRWRNPPTGEPDGLTEAQIEMVAQMVRGKLRSGWAINRANARLARQADKRHQRVRERQAAEEKECAAVRKPQATGKAEVVQKVQPTTPVTQPIKRKPTESAQAEAETPAPEASAVDDLEGLSPQVVTRLQRVGLNNREAVEETLAAGENIFLALPGIGPATLKAVKIRLSDPVQADHAETECREMTRPEPVFPVEIEPESRVNLQSSASDMVEDEDRGRGEGNTKAKTKTDTKAKLQPLVESESPAPHHPETEPVVTEDETSVTSQPTVQIPEPTITVEGDGVLGQRLLQWQGVARVGLTPVARRLGLGEIQVLIHEDQSQSTLVAYWPGGETTLTCPIDGRAGQMRAVRELVQQIRAAA